MPMTREERHALAARVRLGETVSKPRYSERYKWLSVECAVVNRNRTQHAIKELCLGVVITHKLGFSPHSTMWVWEDGSPVGRYSGEYQAAVLAYLERD